MFMIFLTAIFLEGGGGMNIIILIALPMLRLLLSKGHGHHVL